MRFLIGLICGAGLIFAAVGALGTGNGAMTDRLPAWLDDVAVRVGDWLSLPPRPPSGSGGRSRRVASGAGSGSRTVWLPGGRRAGACRRDLRAAR